MQYETLPQLNEKVSKICLGTMTWAQQNTEEQAHAQMDMALSEGVNFWDTAEMYPSPPAQDKQGDTERFMGTWFNKTKQRDKVVLASKISPMGFLRDGQTRYTAEHISGAIDDNLKRLQTDYIDIYQLHWPERQTNFFGKRGYDSDMAAQSLDDLTPFLETIQALNDEIKKGRIRAYGLSNDTAWGLMRYLWEAEKNGLIAPITVQNPYSLLNRLYEVSMAEIAHRENVGLLAYSPLGFGVLSGKYLDGKKPAGARLTMYDRFSRYINEEAKAATAEYAKVADDAGLDMAQMALAFVNSRPFVSSNIIGATSLEQLKSNIDSVNLTLSTDVLDAIEAVHARYPNPSP
ncbi:NADP(H)-dependent aldo-keto reductase [Psychrobacter sp.]|uniref:NADP(H)-dependent aldo-keto reductase n=1 Tax=Psychrobacter sp. TaxID=56811 RepID=UPI0026485559|nr:NADP(H)-dependent aldo-keto reductase [Psychrobacter sp.]MDN6276251.1 NADP(H)-dependent aldo-keto reductase [Psychrobacter sp.]MDN6307814.1 NADP(H)-dependent aldo-keto reductase [Psychrobacter sp.]